MSMWFAFVPMVFCSFSNTKYFFTLLITFFLLSFVFTFIAHLKEKKIKENILTLYAFSSRLILFTTDVFLNPFVGGDGGVKGLATDDGSSRGDGVATLICGTTTATVRAIGR